MLVWKCLQASWTCRPCSSFGKEVPRTWPRPTLWAANIYIITLQEQHARLIYVFPVTPKPKLIRSYCGELTIFFEENGEQTLSSVKKQRRKNQYKLLGIHGVF